MIRRILIQLILAAVYLYSGLQAGDGRKPVIQFSHELHVQDVGVRCTKCHNPKLLRTSMRSEDSILPTEKRCLKCHEVWKEEGECENCHLGKEPYGTFSAVVRNFNFPHKVHWAKQKIDCAVCHSDMSGIDNYPPIPKMADCLSCHQERKAPENCSACHDVVARLRPQNHTPTWLKDHDVAALSNTADCQLCHTQLTCDNCHSGARLGGDLPQLNPVPSYRQDMMKGKLLLSRNHDLNYVYFHGLDANTKAKDCRVCHEAPEFCTDCHQNRKNPIANKPDFHDGLNWGAVVYEPGTDFANNVTGGAHAELARRDIELCQSCHDVEGADPTCTRCHLDKDGIQNTDPKTHEAGFMHNTQGDWCTEPVSLCFTCHTRQTTKGNGFCGYCHSS